MKIQKVHLPGKLDDYEWNDAVSSAMRDERDINGVALTGGSPGGAAAGFELIGCVIDGCCLQNWAFDRVFFTDVRFERCDLSGAVFDGCVFHRVEFCQCKLVGVTLRAATLRYAQASECAAGYANFAGSVLRDCVLEDCSFDNANFGGCRLEGLELVRDSFQNAEFLHTKLGGLDFTSCDINGITLAGEELCGMIVTPEQAAGLARFLGVVIR